LPSIINHRLRGRSTAAWVRLGEWQSFYHGRDCVTIIYRYDRAIEVRYLEGSEYLAKCMATSAPHPFWRRICAH